MAYFTVLEDQSDKDRLEAAENALLIKEGFSWVALFVPVFWPLLYGQVGSFAFLFIAMGLLSFMVLSFDLPLYIGVGILLAGNLLVAFEANNWRRHLATRRGLQTITIAEGRSRKKAKQRFLSELTVPTLETEPAIQSVEEQVQEAMETGAPTIEEIQDQSRAPNRPLSVEQTLWTFLGLRDRPFVEDRGAVGPPDFTFSLEGEDESRPGRRSKSDHVPQAKGTRRSHRRRR